MRAQGGCHAGIRRSGPDGDEPLDGPLGQGHPRGHRAGRARHRAPRRAAAHANGYDLGVAEVALPDAGTAFTEGLARVPPARGSRSPRRSASGWGQPRGSAMAANDVGPQGRARLLRPRGRGVRRHAHARGPQRVGGRAGAALGLDLRAAGHRAPHLGGGGPPTRGGPATTSTSGG